MTVFDALSYDNPVFRGYITWGGLLLLKLLFMAPLTGFQRIRNKAFENSEDVAQSGGEIKKDEHVERVRRAHLNDLENVIPFLIAALMYVITQPQPDVALWLIRVAVVARFLHTIVYAIYPVRQPARGICFFTTLSITLFMIVWSIVYFCHF